MCLHVLLLPLLPCPVPGSFSLPQLSTRISAATRSQLDSEVELKELRQYKEQLGSWESQIANVIQW